MSRTHTLYVDLQRLQADGSSSLTVIRLMMACNDILLANHCLSVSKNVQSKIRQHVQRGAGMYFVRLQCGHLNEALKIVQEINKDSSLINLIDRCSQRTKDSFNILVNCLKGGSNYKSFENYVGRIRHSTVFHYDNKKLVKIALSDRAGRKEASQSKVTFGDHISLSRFELADDIVDSIVCRQICKIPRTADLRQEIDKIMVWTSDLAKSLIEFSGEFIYKYVQEHAAI